MVEEGDCEVEGGWMGDWEVERGWIVEEGGFVVEKGDCKAVEGGWVVE